MPDQRIQGDPGITQVSELIRLAKRFGLTWTRRPGTVESITPPYNPQYANVIMDGDDGGIPVTSLTGDLFPGARVMVDIVPPAGNYAVGTMGNQNDLLAVASTTSTVTFIGEQVCLTLPTKTYYEGAVYRMEMGNATLGVGAGLNTIYRIRKGTTVGGTLWAQSGSFVMIAGVATNARWVCFLTPTVTTMTQLCLTTTIPGPGGSHYATAVTPRFLSVAFVGGVAQYPQANIVT